VEENQLLPKTQVGFRKGKGTNEALAHLVFDAQMARAENKVMACHLVDLKDRYIQCSKPERTEQLFGISRHVRRSD
jgi:hypothetical protein